MYDDELKFEHDLVEALKQNGWTDGVLNHPTEKELIQNWANILFENNRGIDRLNNYPLTEGEMGQIIEQINERKTPLKLNNYINGKTISIIRDNPDDIGHFGKEISLKIYDRQEIAAGQSRYQIAKQPIFKTNSPLINDRRGDIMLLINGMPVIHVELKRSNETIKQATIQVEKYAYEGVYSGLFQLVQVFVAMTPEETVYFANPGPNGKFNPAFYFHWEDFNNEIINNWKDITRTLLSIPMAHQLIGFYTVADDTDNILKVMRSYQYYAANKISDVVSKNDWYNHDNRGGYIWHTTGSGKTMTSFKSAQLIANSKDADKVLFLMDRIELGTQSLSDYRGFADDIDDVQGTEDTRDLITKLKSDDPKDTLIVTSIQKMSLVKEKIKDYTYDLEKITKKRIVFIIDECHRNTFGEMMANIKEVFSNALYFGFTGTPIIDENTKKLSVTADVFGNELHRYVIADGIRDKNVLGFDKYKALTYKDNDLRTAVALEKAKAKNIQEAIENPEKSLIFYKYMNDLQMAGYENENGEYIKGIEDYIKTSQYRTRNHQEQVVNNIIDNWLVISRNNEYSAIFATSSIPEAISYYRLFKEKEANKIFNITLLVDPTIDNKEGFEFKEEGLKEIIGDYNELYNQNFSLSNSNAFKKDVSLRLAHKKPYNRITKQEQIDLLIVVDQMLTGFDSKWINTLYLDKVLEHENIIQAFSRTNRVHNEHKPFGIIKYYRKPYTMERNIEKAIEMYSGNKPFQLFVPKLEENIKKMDFIYKELQDLFSNEGIENFLELPADKNARKKFVQLYNEFNKYLEAAIIQGYIPKDEDDDTKYAIVKELTKPDVKEELNNDHMLLSLNSIITHQGIEALKQRYKDLSKSKRDSDDTSYDIESYLIEIDDGKIDSDYMNSKFTKYLKILEQQNITKEELEESLKNLHKSFSALPQEKQKYANMLLHDIESGNITIEVNKNFMDYITEYEVNASNDQIRKISNSLGLDESKLRNLMQSSITKSRINEYGKFDDLINTVNINKAKEFFENTQNRSFSIFETNIEIENLLKKFILENGFDIEKYKTKE